MNRSPVAEKLYAAIHGDCPACAERAKQQKCSRVDCYEPAAFFMWLSGGLLCHAHGSEQSADLPAPTHSVVVS